MASTNTVDLLPEEFYRYALAIQRGYDLHWSAVQAMQRSGLAIIRNGAGLSLSATGLAAAGRAKIKIDEGTISIDGYDLPYEPDGNNESNGGNGTTEEIAQPEATEANAATPNTSWANRIAGIDTGHSDVERADPEGATLESPISSEQDRHARHALGQFAVNRDAAGEWRWSTISSSGYKDADGELITSAALAADVERADRDGDYGPLVWWHEYEPLLTHHETGEYLLYSALVLGHCDYNAMAGPQNQFLLESGTFVNDEIAEAMANHADELAVSIKFTYDKSTRDEDGTYHSIRRRERSLLPRNREANLFTTFSAVR